MYAYKVFQELHWWGKNFCGILHLSKWQM